MQIEEQIPLAPLTTFKIGGPARYFARVASTAELQEALAFAKEKNLKIFFLGGGSNILVDDTGFDGLVIKVEVMCVEDQGTTFVVGAGESWDTLVARAVDKNLWGIENLSGIPGLVGGAVVQNIGAYGQALSETLQWVEVYDTKDLVAKKLSREECRFGYRGSVFKEGRYVVISVALRLSASGKPNISYKDLAARFTGQTPSLTELRQAVLEIRAAKFPNLSEEGTAGSFFKNPILREAEAKKLQEKYPDLPLFDMPETAGKKVPLAWLLDRVLNIKGTAVGGARLFERQPLVIAAQRNASANDVKQLAALVKEKVQNTFNIAIEPEVTMI